MSVTASTQPEELRSRLFGLWLVIAAVCAAAMVLLPEYETVPFHLAWFAMALFYGFEAWPLGRTFAAMAAYTVLTGWILTAKAESGQIAWEETTEIPLMSMLVLLAVWHVRRRVWAMKQVAEVAAQEQQRSARREELGRLTSHEMRTPTTVALGHVELLLADEGDPGRRMDLEIIQEELGRLVRASDRVVRMIRVEDQCDRSVVDVDELLGGVARRWSVVADRRWMVTRSSALIDCSQDRLRAALDTLIENAVRYTADGDVVRLVSRAVGGTLLLGVADSGPGIAPGRADVEGDQRNTSFVGGADAKSQTGLGLTLVREIAETRGGKLVTGTSAEGGALVLMCLPDVVVGMADRRGASTSPLIAGQQFQ